MVPDIFEESQDCEMDEGFGYSNYTNDRMALFFVNRYIIANIAQEYYNGKVDIDKLIDKGTDGLMIAVNSLKSKEQLECIDFKDCATFYIKSAINEFLKRNDNDNEIAL
jgi:DNA-directed RNA polymerase specialized sigma subunit